jgi:hypothetical protein
MNHPDYEAINATIERAEKTFADLRLGVTACVSLGPTQALHFKKDGKTWQLMIEKVTGHPTTDPELMPLHKCSAKTRLAALDCLPELYEALLMEARTQSDHIFDAVQKAEAFLNQLKGPDAEPNDH